MGKKEATKSQLSIYVNVTIQYVRIILLLESKLLATCFLLNKFLIRISHIPLLF